jgi:hypothetical protein
VISRFDPDIQERGDQTSSEVIKDMMEMLVMRDGFQIGGAANYVIENWNNMRHAVEELQVEGQLLLSELNDWDRNRLTDSDVDCYDRWLENKSYSPDRAEKFRAVAREKLATQGVK